VFDMLLLLLLVQQLCTVDVLSQDMLLLLL
jgi:hypothetical protein